MLGSTQTNVLNGVEELRLYRSEYNERHSVLRPRPVHDWTSHCADAFQMAAIAAVFLLCGLPPHHVCSWHKADLPVCPLFGCYRRRAQRSYGASA
jgi:hypothetical protein